MPIPVTKAELAQLYGISTSVLAKFMNSEKYYYSELEKEGYLKTSVTLSPKVVRKFIECHGEPLTEKDF